MFVNCAGTEPSGSTVTVIHFLIERNVYSPVRFQHILSRTVLMLRTDQPVESHVTSFLPHGLTQAVASLRCRGVLIYLVPPLLLPHVALKGLDLHL